MLDQGARIPPNHSCSTNNMSTTDKEDQGYLASAAETVQNAASSVASKVSHTWDAAAAKGDEKAAEARKEANKTVMKDSDAPVGDRIQAAGHAVGDKMDETKAKGQTEYHQEAAKR